MSDLLFKQFALTRGNFLDKLESIDPSIFDVKPVGFNNTIRWHAGHVLTVTEQTMFGYPKKSTHLPEQYLALFSRGTSPADWPEKVPELEELTANLKNQAERLQQIPADSLKETLKKPFRDLHTFGELANFVIFHEAFHLGQIHLMERVINHAKNEKINA
jgi:uncharacterized damage-inducible protein DinB